MISPYLEYYLRDGGLRAHAGILFSQKCPRQLVYLIGELFVLFAPSVK